uniref:Uncharacterized protein n=1 Tax=Aegilops tauschii subsp. strangulata TaxID=200361 RepID=A0A453JRC3_AEGTS
FLIGSVTRRGDAEGEGAEGGVERRCGDPGGEGLHGNGRSRPRPQARRHPEAAAAAAAASQGAGDGQQQQQQLQRRPAGGRSGREQLPRHLLPRPARPRHRAPQAHPQRIVALEGRISVHQPDGRGDAEDEEQACRRDHNQEEEERGGGRVQGPGGVAGAAPAGGRRAPALLRPAHGGAPGDRVRVREPEGARHVDQGRGAPPRHRRRPQALRMIAAVSSAVQPVVI